MPKETIFEFEPIEGKIVVQDREKLAEHLKRIKGPHYLIIKKKTRQRSLNANSYYWSEVVTRIAEETGNDLGTVHEALKLKFNPKSVRMGELLIIPGSTKEMDTFDFMQYIEKCIAYGSSELGITFMNPEEFKAKRGY